eukprot:m51a1_g3835 hypothetical protein (587) ;mRNA; f:334767-336578
MGVEGFHRWAREHKCSDYLSVLCENLYIDLNDILHTVGGGPGDLAAIRNICLELANTIDALRPSSLVFIAVDGVPPFAKARQQRLRRFGAVRREMDAQGVPLAAQSSWTPAPPPAASGTPARARGALETCRITPGTRFHVALGRALAELADGLARRNAGLAVVVSDAGVPGEGEAKMFDAVRAVESARPGAAQPQHEGDSTWFRHLCFGGDADIVVRAIGCVEARSIAVVSERIRGQYVYVTHVGMLRDVILEAARGGVAADSACDERVLRDIVALSACAPNDFLPGQLHSFDVLPAAYAAARKADNCRLAAGTYVVDLQGSVDMALLLEVVMLAKHWRIPACAQSKKLKSCLQDKCRNYLCGVAWFARYYLCGDVVSWSWSSTYEHAPSVNALHAFVALGGEALLEPDLPVSPVQHLLRVTPGQLRSLVPKALHREIVDPASPAHRSFFVEDVILRDEIDAMVQRHAASIPELTECATSVKFVVHTNNARHKALCDQLLKLSTLRWQEGALPGTFTDPVVRDSVLTASFMFRNGSPPSYQPLASLCAVNKDGAQSHEKTAALSQEGTAALQANVEQQPPRKRQRT